MVNLVVACLYSLISHSFTQDFRNIEQGEEKRKKRKDGKEKKIPPEIARVSMRNANDSLMLKDSSTPVL